MRVPAASSSQVYARRRFGVGVALGAAVQLLLAIILGFVLVGGMIFIVRIIATLLSCLIATPLVFSAGFALMLKEPSRALGGGAVTGALASTIFLVIVYFLA